MHLLIKIIKWSLDYDSFSDDHISTPVLLQDINGPCPLIALVNTLLIQNELHSENDTERKNAVRDLKSLLLRHSETGSIAVQTILDQIGELILVFRDYEEIDDLLESLPKLHTGLSVNPNLVNGQFDENQVAARLFQLFGLKFRHGWCINRIDNEDVEWNGPTNSTNSHSSEENPDNYSRLIELFSELQTFDRIQDYLLMTEAPSNIDHMELLKNQRLLKKWLNLNQTQLTAIGLKRLDLELQKEEFAVFFRNNHFSTLFKKGPSEFYLLVTDSALQSDGITWQSLNSVSGKDDLFFNGDFLPVFDLDFGGLKKMQEEEDEKSAREMEQREKTIARKESKKVIGKKKKRGGCVIV